MEVELVFEQPIPSLLPLAPILKGGGEQFQVRKALTRLRQDETLDELEPLLAFFATFVLEIELVQQIMRWDRAVLLESPWYRQISEEGETIGEKWGEKKGLLSGISTILEYRFGTEGLQLLPEIQSLEEIEVLEAVLAAIKTGGIFGGVAASLSTLGNAIAGRFGTHRFLVSLAEKSTVLIGQ